MPSSPPSGQERLPSIDVSVPHSASVWNYWLGGKDNYSIDREVGDRVRSLLPSIVDLARGERGFLVRAVRYLAGEAGIRQFLDIGTGLPTANNTHEVAQSAAPECRIVYVDNDPLVLAHARALLTSSPHEIARFFDGLEVLEPGIVSPTLWRPAPVEAGTVSEVGQFCGVGKKITPHNVR